MNLDFIHVLTGIRNWEGDGTNEEGENNVFFGWHLQLSGHQETRSYKS